MPEVMGRGHPMEAVQNKVGVSPYQYWGPVLWSLGEKENMSPINSV
jgi:hypothetical protein